MGIDHHERQADEIARQVTTEPADTRGAQRLTLGSDAPPLIEGARSVHSARDARITSRTAQLLGAGEPTRLSVFEGPRVDVAAARMSASAFTWRDQIYMSSTSSPASRASLLAHEAAHVYQKPRHDDTIRRAGVKFTGDTGELRTTIVDELGNHRTSDTMESQFIKGAFKYLGIEFTEGRTGDLNPTDKRSSSRRSSFIQEYAGGKTMPQSIVVSPGKLATKDVVISPDYAASVFDAAVNIALTASVWVRENTSAIQNVAVQQPPGSSSIEVKPSLYQGYFMDETVAAAYDGFWIILHELLHKDGSKHFSKLATERNTSVTEAETGSKVAESSDTGTWESDYPGQHAGKDPAIHEEDPGPIVSIVNVLRAGYGLPIRAEYGYSHDSGGRKYTTIAWYHFDKGANKYGARMNDAIVREVGVDTWREMREISEQMSYNNLHQDTIWTNRLSTSELHMDLDGSTKRFNHVHTKLIGARKFHAVMKDDEGNGVTLQATWKKSYESHLEKQSGGIVDSNWPHIEMGWVFVDLDTPADKYTGVGTGDFESPDPFYEETASGNLMDAAYLKGSWKTTNVVMKEKSGNWILALGGSSYWDVSDIGDI